MRRERHSVDQIVVVVKQQEMGAPVVEIVRKLGITAQTLYRRKKVYGGLELE